MKIGFFSDVHSNIEALHAVVKELSARGVSHFACCGDIVGYGPDPVPCLETIRELNGTVVAGNHDRGAAGLTSTSGFSPAAARALEWTRVQLDGGSLRYLASLPLTAECRSTLLVHATPSAPAQWEYVFTVREAEEEMGVFPQNVCVVGHSHHPFVVEQSQCSQTRLLLGARFDIRPGCKYLINVGSTGQPRDGDPRACCLLFDSVTGVAEFIRVPYDVAAVQIKMRAVRLPEFLAARLAVGR